MTFTSADLDAAASQVLSSRRGDTWHARITGNPNQPGHECIVVLLASALQDRDERFGRMLKMISGRQTRENKNRNVHLPLAAAENEIRAFYAIMIGVPLPRCPKAATAFLNKYRPLRGADGLRKVAALIFPAAQAAEEETFTAADLGLEEAEVRPLTVSTQRAAVAVGS